MGRPVRILHTVVNMNRGGAETMIMNLYRHIDRSKVQFDFLTCNEGVFDEEIRLLGGVIHRIPYMTESGHFNYIRNLNHFFHRHSYYKIVHSHMDKMSGFVLQAAKKQGIPVRIAHSHNTESEGNIFAKIYKNYSGKLIGQASTHHFACSNAAAQWLYGEQDPKKVVMKNGIAPERFKHTPEIRDRLKKELGLNHKYVIGHVGRFNLQKNHDFLIDIFYECTKKYMDLHLVLAGDGQLKQQMEDKVTRLKLTDKVSFLGVRHDIDQLLQAFDLFVFPSFHEGLPVTLIEAQGSGLPCIISDRITKEADMGVNLVTYLSLDHQEKWISAIPQELLRKKQRVIPDSALAKKGYDIRHTADWVQEFYLSAAR
ncbi:glycosyltransferase family 1 protein [Bacillus sp. FJAT-42376]|uniref:glycosyltransferase family 1 protein n=1 Tax=Bacillus sp. FJAT-42376 TaxID=2014076 RepID=UPI000F50F7D1|nr:glycosyltransferase family 1 protein [Bacillus sp. FJAT-42376]AZB43592.1 glycosyltransferase family 1 protein [Bacillus sp. FJAT-42376]